MGAKKPSAEIVRLEVPQASSIPAARSDDELMLLARGGVESAFDTIVRRYQYALLKTAHRYVGDLQSMEDVVQDTFIDLYRHLPRYRAEGKLRALLFRSLLNRARMARRTWRRARLYLITPPEIATPPEAEDRILEHERQREIQGVVQGLPDRYRRVVALRFGADLSYAEIGDVLDIPVGTVKSRMFTALRKLEKKLGAIEW